MAYTTVDNPELYFQTKLYTGNGGTQSITLDGSENMQPDWVWFKNRTDAGQNHLLYDSVRGATKTLKSSTTGAEVTDSGGLTSFDSDGFSVGDKGSLNNSSASIVAWNWKAGGSASSNSNGSITSTVSANQTAGFSIVSYTATSGMSSIGHGLGVTPSVIFLKTRDQSASWFVGNASLGWDKILFLNLTNASSTDDRVFSPSAGSDPTSSVFFSDQAGVANAGTMIAYCFAEKKGYSKFGSYTGNGSLDGSFVYTGFKPAFVIITRTDSGDNWMIHDDKREGYNPANDELMANLSNAEQAYDTIDLLSNGFKLRHTAGRSNNSGGTYIYMAFGQSLVGSNNVPCTAR